MLESYGSIVGRMVSAIDVNSNPYNKPEGKHRHDILNKPSFY